MSKYVGRRAAIGLAKETVRGTAVAPTYWLPVESSSINDKVEKQVQQSGFGVIADSDNSFVVNKYAEGSLSFHLEDKALGLMLFNLLGAVSTAGSTNYVHTFTYTNTNQHQSLTVGSFNPNESKLFPLSMINEFGITVEPNGFVTADVSFMSRIAKDWTTLSPTYTAVGNKFLHQHLSFKVAANLAGLAAASTIDLKGLDYSIAKNLLKEDVAGTVAPGDIVNQEMSVSGSVTLTHDDNTWRDYLLNGTPKAVEIKFTYGANNYLTFQMPYVTFETWELDGGLGDIINQKLDFKAHYDFANAAQQISTCTLANQVTSY